MNKVKDIEVNTNELQQKWENLSTYQKTLVNHFLCLRELTYDRYKLLSEEAKTYIDLIFPNVSK